MADTFKRFTSGLESPATRLNAVIPDDATDLAFASRALNVGASGYVRVTTTDGDIATVFVSAGAAFPVRARRVWSTGTTATSIVAMF